MKNSNSGFKYRGKFVQKLAILKEISVLYKWLAHESLHSFCGHKKTLFTGFLNWRMVGKHWSTQY